MRKYETHDIRVDDPIPKKQKFPPNHQRQKNKIQQNKQGNPNAKENSQEKMNKTLAVTCSACNAP